MSPNQKRHGVGMCSKQRASSMSFYPSDDFSPILPLLPALVHPWVNSQRVLFCLFQTTWGVILLDKLQDRWVFSACTIEHLARSLKEEQDEARIWVSCG